MVLEKETFVNDLVVEKILSYTNTDKLVYCSECKHYYPRVKLFSIHETCEHPSNIDKVEKVVLDNTKNYAVRGTTKLKIKTHYKSTPSVKNQHNNCLFFEEKKYAEEKDGVND